MVFTRLSLVIESSRNSSCCMTTATLHLASAQPLVTRAGCLAEAGSTCLSELFQNPANSVCCLPPWVLTVVDSLAVGKCCQQSSHEAERRCLWTPIATCSSAYLPSRPI